MDMIPKNAINIFAAKVHNPLTIYFPNNLSWYAAIEFWIVIVSEFLGDWKIPHKNNDYTDESKRIWIMIKGMFIKTAGMTGRDL